MFKASNNIDGAKLKKRLCTFSSNDFLLLSVIAITTYYKDAYAQEQTKYILPKTPKITHEL